MTTNTYYMYDHSKGRTFGPIFMKFSLNVLFAII